MMRSLWALLVALACLSACVSAGCGTYYDSYGNTYDRLDYLEITNANYEYDLYYYSIYMSSNWEYFYFNLCDGGVTSDLYNCWSESSAVCEEYSETSWGYMYSYSFQTFDIDQFLEYSDTNSYSSDDGIVIIYTNMNRTTEVWINCDPYGYNTANDDYAMDIVNGISLGPNHIVISATSAFACPSQYYVYAYYNSSTSWAWWVVIYVLLFVLLCVVICACCAFSIGGGIWMKRHADSLEEGVERNPSYHTPTSPPMPVSMGSTHSPLMGDGPNIYRYMTANSWWGMCLVQLVNAISCGALYGLVLVDYIKGYFERFTFAGMRARFTGDFNDFCMSVWFPTCIFSTLTCCMYSLCGFAAKRQREWLDRNTFVEGRPDSVPSIFRAYPGCLPKWITIFGTFISCGLAYPFYFVQDMRIRLRRTAVGDRGAIFIGEWTDFFMNVFCINRIFTCLTCGCYACLGFAFEKEAEWVDAHIAPARPSAEAEQMVYTREIQSAPYAAVPQQQYNQPQQHAYPQQGYGQQQQQPLRPPQQQYGQPQYQQNFPQQQFTNAPAPQQPMYTAQPEPSSMSEE